MKDPAFLIINPSASKGSRGKKKNTVELLKKRRPDIVVGYTNSPGHAELLATNAVRNGFKTIIAAGGDGTVNEVINGIMRAPGHEETEMGIIPLGRGNDFAWIAKIPTKLDKALDLLLTGEAKPTDVGFIKGTEHPEGKYFLNGAGFGFEPMVNFRAMEYERLNGMPSYIAGFLYILFNPPSGYDVTLDVDGKEYKLQTQQISVANGRRMGSAFMMTPLAEIDDGKLDIMFTTHSVKGWGLIKLVIDFLKGSHVKDRENFNYLRAKRISIRATTDDVKAHHDGEIFTKHGKSFTVEVLPGAVNMIRG